MIAQTEAASALFPVLAFPLILPLMILAIKGCERAALGLDAAGWPEVRMTVAYVIIMVVLSLFLFPLVWKEC